MQLWEASAACIGPKAQDVSLGGSGESFGMVFLNPQSELTLVSAYCTHAELLSSQLSL